MKKIVIPIIVLAFVASFNYINTMQQREEEYKQQKEVELRIQSLKTQLDNLKTEAANKGRIDLYPKIEHVEKMLQDTENDFNKQKGMK